MLESCSEGVGVMLRRCWGHTQKVLGSCSEGVGVVVDGLELTWYYACNSSNVLTMLAICLIPLEVNYVILQKYSSEC